MKKFLTLLFSICILFGCDKEDFGCDEEDSIVTPIEATEIKLSESELTLDVGDTYELTYQISPDDTTDKSVTWSSSDESVATVKDGVVTALFDGVCNISATVNGSISDICSVTVKLVPITSIIIDPQTTTIDIDASFQFGYSLFPENATDYGLVWKSSDESVATVNAGVCIGVTEGNTTIILETSDGQIKASVELIVKDMYPYCEVGQSYTSKYGFDVVINSISTSENTTTQKNTCSINYTITNITTDQVLSEITFKCKTQSGEYESQYGFFGDLYPSESQTRSYSFTSLISNPFTRVELAPLFWNEVIDSSQSELIWKVE